MEEQQQDYFTQKRIELVVEMANKKVLSEIHLLKQTVRQLENELTSLRQKAQVQRVAEKSAAQYNQFGR